MNEDWRLQRQERYLKGATLFLKQYTDRKTKTDHDHCEFCWKKFSDTIPDALRVGYTTADDYRWICRQCFEDFKEMFQFKLGNTTNEEGT
jgi:hypothetical protein